MSKSRKRALAYAGAVLLGPAFGFWAGTRKARAQSSTPNVAYSATGAGNRFLYVDPANGKVRETTDITSLPAGATNLTQIQSTTTTSSWTQGTQGGQLGSDTDTWFAKKVWVRYLDNSGNPAWGIYTPQASVGLKALEIVVIEYSHTDNVYFATGA